MNSKIKKGIIILLVSTIIAYAMIIIFFLQDIPNDISLNISLSNLLIIFLLFIGIYVFNVLRVYELVKTFTDKFTLKDSFLFTMGGIFLGLITPFQSGGIPFQVYLMNRRGVSPGEGTSLLFIRGIQSFIVFLFTVPFTFIFFSFLFNNRLVNALFKYLLSFYLIVIIVILITIFLTKFLRKLYNRIKFEKIRNAALKILDEAENFKNGMLVFFNKGKKHFIISMLYAFVSLYLLFSITHFLILLVVGESNFMLSFNIQLLLTYLLAFVPTPGSGGFAEGGGALFYSLLVPKSKILLYIFLWRIITTYLPSLIGFISIFNYSKSFMKSEK
ncbi:flippase-like domain-containing protein [candidate division WOR-3 bacterium]|nr:flippase-like domain-containing protein [candidate division WOR-3 bacterium]